MNELPEEQWLDEVLYRRAGPRSVDRNGRIRANAFRLRADRGEPALSFHAASRTTVEDVLRDAPGLDWGIVSIRVAELVALGFTVTFDGRADAAPPGNAHVSGVPPELDAEGQIPLALLEAIANVAHWTVRPRR